jgi:hypothetical protein
MLTFCTLFNSSFLTRGLAMHESLLRNCPNFHLYIFAFDNDSFYTLRALDLRNATIISLEQFEDEELLKIKPTRSAREYCWTCTPSTISYIINKYQTDHCTYIDADLYFYSDPKVLIDEMGEKSVLITEHRYTPKYKRPNEMNGKYCVQFMTFKNTKIGLQILDWWRIACNEWCYAIPEDGKFGDQKYLEDWTTRFSGVHVLENLGGGVAPWNIQQYVVNNNQGDLYGTETKTGKVFPFVFYHFHGLRFYQAGIIDLCEYEIRIDIRKLIYKPYIMHLEKLKAKLKLTFPCIETTENLTFPRNSQEKFRRFKIWLRGHHNIIHKAKILH